MGIKERILGAPWIYERLRIGLLGGGPAREVLGWLSDTRDDVLVDVGCGTGMALEMLGAFREYHGFDTDARALARFREKKPGPNVHLHNRRLAAADLEQFRPSKAILTGVLHHMPDEEALELLAMLAHSASLDCCVTLDPVRVVGGKPINNLLCRLDRGRWVRNEAQYAALIERAGWHCRKRAIFTSGNGLAVYFCTKLARR